MTYLSRHWTGKSPIYRAFFLNLALPQLLLAAAQTIVVTTVDPVVISGFDSLISAIVILQIVHFVWGAVGVFRSSEEELKHGGAMTVQVIALLGIVGIFWISSVNALGLWIVASQEPPPEENFAERMDREHASQYRLDYDRHTSTIHLDGLIALGSSKALNRLLGEAPAAKRIILTSVGGNIYEARGLSRIIRENNLETRVEGVCSSACTVVFAGGKRRSAGPDARLGFHQYSLDADYDVPFVDIAGEQERDREVFARAGISDWFLEKIFDADSQDMWFPSLGELKRAQVITHD